MRKKFASLRHILLLLTAVGGMSLPAQNVVYKLNDSKTLDYLVYPQLGGDTIQFNTGEMAGPSLMLNGENLPFAEAVAAGKIAGSSKGLRYSIAYDVVKNDLLKLTVTCKNVSDDLLKDVQLSLRLGINTCMRSFPQWRSIYFPTLLKCEKTHFWGYFMNPDGKILTVASPDPIASYHLGYNNNNTDFSNGHLIHTAYLDLLNPEPLPAEHPDYCNHLKKGESREWSIYLTQVAWLEDVGPKVQSLTQAPFLSSELYTVDDGEQFTLNILSQKKPNVKILSPDGKKYSLKASQTGNHEFRVSFRPRNGKGVYTVKVESQRKTSYAWMSVRYDWSDYIKAARQACLDYPQIASSHTEGWYGFFSSSIAERYFPNPEIDHQAHEKFNELYPLMYDTATFLPSSWESRIQNHGVMASLLAHKYHAEKDEKYLLMASALVDFLLSRQSHDGAYRNGQVHYTCVVYQAKVIAEVMEIEKELGKTSKWWKSQYSRHYSSVRKAVDELARSLDNIQTEGEMTFEDGMISCSYSQLAMFALMQPKGSEARAKYTKAAEYLVDSHRCLSQLLIPDSRVHGASIRFWESQYDILTYPNFVNSPHGWSAWRIYGLKYLYQLTGKERYLMDMQNAIGTCAQLLNPSTGELNWSFVADPYVPVKYFVEDKNHPGRGCRVDSIIGRQYLKHIGSWYRAPKNTFVTGYWGYDGGCCSNDVHEIFKCMGEVVLTSAYLHVREDGSYIALNCKVTKERNKWIVEPESEVIEVLYTNSEKVKFDKGRVSLVG